MRKLRRIERLEQRVEEIAAKLGMGATPTADKKTRLEWLNELPDGYRERAVANCDEHGHTVSDSMHNAIGSMCAWYETLEGVGFWNDVYKHYKYGTPLPPLPVEVYEAGFNFEAVIHSLNLPDGGYLCYANESWAKLKSFYAPQPHTLKTVERHTVGRFYRLLDGNKNRFDGYALCVGNNDFVQARLTNGTVTVEYWGKGFVSMDEVTPLP